MLWLYFPPIILVGALIVLVVVLGRKSAEMKKIKTFPSDQSATNPISGEHKNWKKFWNKFLQYFEKFLMFLKIGVKKSEMAIANLTVRIRSRRGKTTEKNFFGEDSANRPAENEIIERKAKIFGEIEKIESVDEEFLAVRKTEWVSSEVTTKKRKIEEPVIRMKEVPAQEDKVKEEALIHRIAENPRDIEAYRDLGDYYMAIGNIKDAKDSFKMVLKLRPRDLKAKSSLREIEMKMRLGS
jgi:hypothetical protein